MNLDGLNLYEKYVLEISEGLNKGEKIYVIHMYLNFINGWARISNNKPLKAKVKKDFKYSLCNFWFLSQRGLMHENNLNLTLTVK